MSNDCLHCVLSRHVQRFVDTHPAETSVNNFGHILQLAADFAASTCVEEDQQRLLVDAPQLLVRLMKESFAGAVGYTRRRQ